MSSAQPYEGTLANADVEYVGAKDYRIRQDDFFTLNKIQAASFYKAPDGYLNRLNNIEGPVLVNVNRKKPEDLKFIEDNKYQAYKKGSHQHVKTYFGEQEGWFPSGNISGEYKNGADTAFEGPSIIERVARIFTHYDKEESSLPNTIDTGILAKGDTYKAYYQALLDLKGDGLKPRYAINDNQELLRGDLGTALIADTLNKSKAGDVVYFSRAFTPYKTIDKALVAAAKRGVKVNVITNAPEDRNEGDAEMQQKLKAGGVSLTYSKKTFAHLKEFSIRGSIDLSLTGSTNYTAANYFNRSTDLTLVFKGKSRIGAQIHTQLEEVFRAFTKKDQIAPSFYKTQEFGFLYSTRYGTLNSRTHGNVESAPDTTGYIKSTKLNSDYFDRHINRKLPHYSGFTSTYEAITGIKASRAIQEMDQAVGSPSIGHQINRALGIKIYSEGMGLVGSLVSLGGRMADYLTGHYAYKRDMERHKGMRGSAHKFAAMLDRDWQQSEQYVGGPIEQGARALFAAAQSMTIVSVGYGAVLAGQYGVSLFLDEGAKRAVEPGAHRTQLQATMSKMYLSPEGRQVSRLAQSYMRDAVAAGGTLSAEHAMSRALRSPEIVKQGITPKDLLGRGTTLPGLLNRMRTVSAGAMSYLLPPILQMVVPEAHLNSALRAGAELIEAIGQPITMDERGLHNLHAEQSKAMGRGIEKLVSHIPAELHLWMPALRAVNNAQGTLPADPEAHHPLGEGRLSLGALMGQGAVQNTIAAFVQTTERFAQAIANPAAEVNRLARDYKFTRYVVGLDDQLARALDRGTATEAGVRRFFAAQSKLSEQLKRYSNNAAIVSRSAENGVLSQGVFRKNAGRVGLIAAGLFVGDFLLDEFVLRNQGADFLRQMSLTRAVRNESGNIIQIQLNGTVPLAATTLTAGVAATASGYIFPTIYGASAHSSRAMQKLSSSTVAGIAEAALGYENYQGTRARFNFKAAAVGSVLGLIALKIGFMGVAAAASLFFPVKGVNLDAEAEVVTGKLLSILNRTKKKYYEVNDQGENQVKAGVTIGQLARRELLKSDVDRFSVSDLQAKNRSAGSNFYSVALQLTNTGFIQSAIVQRTDSLKQRTTYSFGIQLFASASMGLTPNLPFGIITQRTGAKEQLALAKQEESALAERYGITAAQIKGGGIVQSALDMFGFISYEPNSQITQALLGLGTLSYLNAAAERVGVSIAKNGRPDNLKAVHHLDLDAFGKVAKLGLDLTTSFIKYTTALSDFLPRTVIHSIRTAFPELTTNPRFKLMGKLASPLAKGKFAILGYAMATAMTDPYLGVEPLDNSSHTAEDHPYTNPISRLVTAGSAAAYAVYSANALGLNGKPNPNSFLSQAIPGARAAQAQLFDPETNNLRKSGARTSLVAGLVFGTYLASQVLARTIGEMSGEEGLAATYQRVGLLRLLSGVSASDYRKGSAHNLIGDVLGTVLEKIPFIGQPLAKFTGLYKDEAKPHVPLAGTPFGASYSRKDGSTKGYGQSGNGPSDVSVAANTKYKPGYTTDDLKMFARLEQVEDQAFADPDLIIAQVLRGGEARTHRMKVSETSTYSMQNLQGAGEGLARAYQYKQHLTNNLINQRAGEIYRDEENRARMHGLIAIWTGCSDQLLTPTKIGINLGLSITYQEYQSDGKAGNSGDYTTFADAIQNSTYKERNVYTPHIFQNLEDMYAAYTPQSKKREKNMVGAGILSLIGTTASIIMGYNTFLGALEFLGAMEVVKFGKSSNQLQVNRLEVGGSFAARNALDIELTYLNQGTPAVGMRPKGARSGVGFNLTQPLAAYDLQDVHQIRSSYKQGLGALESFFKSPATSPLFGSFESGKSTNAFALLLKGQSGLGTEALRKVFINQLTNESTGILSRGAGNSTLYHLLTNVEPGVTAMEYASNVVAPASMYDSLAVYAHDLEGRAHLDSWQKQELLAAHKVKLEMRAVETHILAQATNSTTPLELAPTSITEAPIGRGFSHTLKRGAAGAGMLLGGYWMFGKDAYAMAEGLTFVTGPDEQLRKAAANQIVSTTTNFGLAVGLQKVVGSLLGTKTFGLVSLAATVAASFGLNMGASYIKSTSWGTLISKAEANTANFFSGVIEGIGAAVNYTGVGYLTDMTLGRFIFKPLGRAIGKAYNDQSRISGVNAMLAQMFLPESVYKTNGYISKRTSVGNIPFVMSNTYGGTDLAAYYRAENAAGLQRTMGVTQQPREASDFTLGRASSSDYRQQVFKDRYFNTQTRSAPSPISDFNISSNYRMSEGIVRAMGQRSMSSDYHRYGRIFRKASQPEHDYIGQLLSGLGTFNEIGRISTQANSGWGRPMADAAAQVDQALLRPVRNGLYLAAKSTAIWTNKLANFTSPFFTAISDRLAFIGEWTAKFMGGAQIITGASVDALAEVSRGGIETSAANTERYLETLGQKISNKFAGPVARVALGALHGAGTLVGAGSSLVVNLIDKIPTVKARELSTQVNAPQFGFNSMPLFTESRVLSTTATAAKQSWNFIRGNMPFYLDVAQILPSTFALQGANIKALDKQEALNAQHLTKMERMRLYEQQGAGVGGTLFGLGAAAFRSNLLTALAVSVVGTFVGGRLGKEGGRSDYDNNSNTYLQVQTGLGIATLGFSAAQSLFSYYRRINIYDNYVQISPNDADSKRAAVVYAENFTHRLEKHDHEIARTKAMPDSKYKTQRLQQLNQQRLGLRFEYHHEQAHLGQFDVATQQFELSSKAVIDQIKADSPHYSAAVDDGLRRLATNSAQDHLYTNPGLDQDSYNRILELEYQGHVRSYTTTMAEAAADGSLDYRHSAEDHLNHYVNKLSRQLDRVRTYTRTPGILPPDATAQPIERLYNPGGHAPTPAGGGQLTSGRVTTGHYHKAANLVTSGVYRTSRVLTAFSTISGLPAALYESATQKSDLENIQSTYGTSNERAIDFALKAKGNNNARYMYATGLTGIFTAIFPSPLGVVATTLYGGLAALGGSIPFTDIPMVPTFGRNEIAEAYAKHQHSRMRSGRYAYDSWGTASTPINTLRNHRFDQADRQLIHVTSRMALNTLGELVPKLVKDTVGFFNARPKLKFAGTATLALAAFTYLVAPVLGMRNTDNPMFAPIGTALTGAAFALAPHALRFADRKLTRLRRLATVFIGKKLIPGLVKYFTAGLSSNPLGRLEIIPGAATTWGSRTRVFAQTSIDKIKSTATNAIGHYIAWNKPIEYGTITSLPSKYLSSNKEFQAGLSKRARTLLMVTSSVQRSANLIHRAARATNLIFSAMAYMVEDFGIRQGIDRGVPELAGSTAKKQGWFSKGIAWAKSYTFAYNSPVTKVAPTAEAELNNVVKRYTLGQKMVGGLGNLAGKVGRGILWALPGAFKILALGIIGKASYDNNGWTGVALSAGMLAATGAAYKYGKALPFGKALGHQILQQGLFNTALTGLSVATETGTILSAAYSLATGKRGARPYKDYERNYVSAASGTAGLISTLELFPRLGVIRGLAATALLSIGMTKFAEIKTEERLEERQRGAYSSNDFLHNTSNFVLAIQDLIKPAIAQTLMARELGAKYDLLMRTKQVSRLRLKLANATGFRMVSKFSRNLLRDAKRVVIERATRTFGDAVGAAADGARSLGAAAEGFGKVLTSGLKKAAVFIDVGLIAYGSYQVWNAKNDEDRKVGYRTAFSSAFSAATFAVVGLLSAPLEAAPGPGTAAHIGLTVTASVALGALGDFIGSVVGDVHNGKFKLPDLGAGANKVFGYIFGGPLNAAEAPSAYSQMKVAKGLERDNTGNLNPIESLGNFMGGVANYLGNQWRNFRIGIGNLHKDAKLKWGRFANLIKSNQYIVGFKKAVQSVVNDFVGALTGTGKSRAIVISAGHIADRGSGEPGSDRDPGGATLTYLDASGKRVSVSGVTGEGTANLVVAERIMAYGKANGYNIINALPSGAVGLGAHLKTIASLAKSNNAQPVEIHHDDRNAGMGGLIASKNQDVLGQDLAKVYGYYANTKLFGAPHAQGGTGRFVGGFGAYNAGVNLLEVDRLSDKQEYGSLVNAYQKALISGDAAAQKITRTTLDAYVDRVIVPKFFKAVDAGGGGNSLSSSGASLSGTRIQTSGGGIGATVNASTYHPGGSGMNAGEIDSRDRLLKASDFVIAIAGQKVLKDQIPYGSMVRLTYKGKSVLAEVRDGGPYIPGRQMDITTGAAQALKFDGVGAVAVTLESLPKGADPYKKYYFGEATYRPVIVNGNVSKAEAAKAVNSVVNGSNYLILGKPASAKQAAPGTTTPVSVTPTQADAIVNPPTVSKLKAASKPKPVNKKATVKYAAPKSTIPAAAGRKLKDLPKTVSVNLRMEGGQLKASAVEMPNDSTYLSQVNMPASTQMLGGRALAS
jgi:hypothetical protein